MSLARRVLSGPWYLVQRIAPGLAAWVRRRRAATRPAAAAASSPRVEEDLALLSDHVARLTARLEEGAAPSAVSEDEVEARITAARLSALAFYEERISRLEDRIAELERGRGDDPRS